VKFQERDDCVVPHVGQNFAAPSGLLVPFVPLVSVLQHHDALAHLTEAPQLEIRAESSG
jgi:hypothetical protein